MDPAQGTEAEAALKEVEARTEEKSPTSPSDHIAAEPLAPSGSSTDSSSEKDVKDLKKLDSRIIQVPDAKTNDDILAHLPEHERNIIKRQIDTQPVNVGILTLYRYATAMDILIIVISTICAIAGGAALPLMTIIFGNLTGYFQQFFLGTLDGDAFRHQLGSTTLYFIYLGIGEFVTIYICTLGFIYTGEHVTQKIREQYLRAILRQNVGFFDNMGAGEITTRITADTNLVQDGMSEKVGLTITALATFFTAFVIGFVKYWALTLILCSTVVAITIVMGSGSGFMIKYTKQSTNSYAVGGSVAEEVISSIRNAVAFGTQEKLAAQYRTHLTEAKKWGIKQKCVMAAMLAGMFWIVFANYGLAYWQGARFLVNGQVSLNSIVTIAMSILIGAFSLGNIGPNVQAFTTALAAAGKIFGTIDRQSPLDSFSEEGKRLENVEGVIELKNIRHIYPSRAEVVVMRNVNLHVPAGKTTALVGASGSGKSTIVGLVERFYDPVGGEVLLDGVNICDLNLRFLRQQIALVSQEPTLFSTTIEGNIRHGLIGSKFESASAEKQKELIIEAAKMANAHDFITELPEGYDTNVGDRGFLLSGGQKQRIAIARAVVSDPKILLLDEATSALDTKSEGVVQAALDRAARGRTTIVIAHRLSTIKDADNIVVMSQGRIVEEGRHGELIKRKGAYFKLVEAQRISAEQERKRAEEEENIEELDDQLTREITKRSEKSETLEKRGSVQRTVTQTSLSSAVLKGKQQAKKKKYSLWTSIKLIAGFNKEEPGLMLIGLFWSIIAGGCNPTSAVFLAKCISTLSLPPPLYGKLIHDISFWALMFFMLAWVQLLGFGGQGIAFAICSERLIFRARDRAFRHILRQDISFFDRDENTAGALTSFLSTETTYVAGLSGTTLGTILSVSTTLVAALVLGISIGWKLGLVCTATLPVMLSAGFFRFWILARFEARKKAAYEKSASYACEATSAIRTVASLTREDDVWETYHRSLDIQGRKSLISVAQSSTLYAFSQAAAMFCMALGFWYGGTLIADREYQIFQFFVCFTAIIFGAQSAGIIFSFAPDMGKAKHAAEQMKTLFDRQPEIDTWSTEGEKLSQVEGTIEFRDVHFRYPTRPEQPVLRGLNLTVKPGQYVALVGASGCGKSTTIQLLERFYDPLAGGVFVDGKEISRWNINDYRSFLALVSQEPTLYQGTIKENILLGASVDESEVSDESIVQACKDANIYDFIMSLPDGFSTVVGSKGSMLSGGQKQRVAIARALIRDPKILLLDEATSALDSESEKVVQAALDRAAQGRTTIAVAHRLSTIQKADMIYVFDQGRIVEKGTHQDLLHFRGKYFELVNLQSLDK